MAGPREIPVALTIAGSDSSAGAGAQADLKTFMALGVYGVNAITCVVAETPGRVQSIEPVSADVVAEQVALLLDSFPVSAVKTGLLYSAEIARRVAEILRDRRLPLVVDPVMVATSGDLLLQKEAVAVYEEELFPLATVITPNLDEARTLLGREISHVAEMRAAGAELSARYGAAVLMKGGHLAGEIALDLLVANGTAREFSAPFTRDVQTHGTGCTYSAAIAAQLARGAALPEAVAAAKEFVSRAIAEHHRWRSSDGSALDALHHH